jgi:hypothetical protein
MSEDTGTDTTAQPAAAAAAETLAAPAVEKPKSKKAKAAEAAEAEAAGGKMVEAVVRRGTVMVGEHGDEEAVGPGGRVTLPEKQVIALRKSGVLHDPDSAPMFAPGPVSDIDQVGATVSGA